MQPSCEDSAVLAIRDEQGVSLYIAEQVKDYFCRYYTDLCTSPFQYDEQAMADYLVHITMKWLTEEHREDLMAPLLPGKIVAALKDMLGMQVLDGPRSTVGKMRCKKGPLSTLLDWHTDVVYCNTQLEAYHGLMQICSHSRDMWEPYQDFLRIVEDARDVVPEEGDELSLIPLKPSDE
ncbi:hypothetical protein NDU88_003485 [Pleurodeles waltl]|uniref:Uncharacterized protein n=1 Tax=Pleurodeles waltl TaxID=8319 RepID=A0AAV7WRT0_PLEWA|nr:hypothetical protein NDU88_003485 [Pleurodeles waltl]